MAMPVHALFPDSDVEDGSLGSSDATHANLGVCAARKRLRESEESETLLSVPLKMTRPLGPVGLSAPSISGPDSWVSYIKFAFAEHWEPWVRDREAHGDVKLVTCCTGTGCASLSMKACSVLILARAPSNK